MSQTREIVILGNPILRETAKPVSQITNPHVEQLIDSLIATAAEAQGVGIAAPQLAQSYRLFIVASRPNQRYPHAPTIEPTAMINPKLLSHGREIVKDWEGCLSVPGIRGLVPRYREIEVEYTNRTGQQERKILTDFVARIFQHELDHLDGILFIDRIEDEQDLFTEAEYQKIISG